MRIEVTAVIPTWNRRDLLRDVLTDLAAQSHPLAKVIVVDNGSTDGAGDAAQAMGAQVLRLATNAGFAHAVNLGVRKARTSHVAILNNDVRLDTRWLELLAEHAERAFVAPKILRAGQEGILDGSFDLLSRSGCAWRAGNGQPDGPAWNTGRVIQFVPFTAVLFRREVFDQVGYLEESFESYLEDVEFGLRCGIAGKTGWYEPRALAWHLGSATLGRWNAEVVRRIARNQVWLVRRHFPPGTYRWPVLAGQLLWGLLALRHGAFGGWVRGKWQGMSGRYATGTPKPEQLARILGDCEADIRRLQEQGGWDLFWRLYFGLS